jgi:hypothetical protein
VNEEKKNEKKTFSTYIQSDFESTKEEKPIGIIYCKCRHENFNV